jgi:hypothetical protein
VQNKLVMAETWACDECWAAFVKQLPLTPQTPFAPTREK